MIGSKVTTNNVGFFMFILILTLTLVQLWPNLYRSETWSILQSCKKYQKWFKPYFGCYIAIYLMKKSPMLHNGRNRCHGNGCQVNNNVQIVPKFNTHDVWGPKHHRSKFGINWTKIDTFENMTLMSKCSMKGARSLSQGQNDCPMS